MNIYTPPKYQAAQQHREAIVLLEERLLHFLTWLDRRDALVLSAPMRDLIEEYVNT